MATIYNNEETLELNANLLDDNDMQELNANLLNDNDMQELNANLLYDNTPLHDEILENIKDNVYTIEKVDNKTLLGKLNQILSIKQGPQGEQGPQGPQGPQVDLTDITIKKIILDISHPINSIIETEDGNFDPNIYYAGTGSEWELLEEGYVLWSSKPKEAGWIVAAGLPNISGKLEYRNPSDNGALFGLLTGAFTLEEKTSSTSWGNTLQLRSGSNNLSKLFFSAKNSNRIYGNSDTVQPPAIKVCMWKRIL